MNAEAKLINVAQRNCDFHRGFLALQDERDNWVSNIRGNLPKDLTGTLFRNGPGAMNAGSEAYAHWFDGPGMISAVTFIDGKVHFKNRYVRTPKYLGDRQQGRVSSRGFGTQIKGGWRKNILKPLSNPANTGVSWHGDKLCAFYEGGQPYRLNPETLETLGPEYYGSTLNPRTTISAHGKIHPRTGNQINFGINLVGLGWRGIKCALDVHDIPANGHNVRSCRIPLDRFPFLHDFGLTENYAIFVVSSVNFKLGGPLLGTTTLSENLRYNDQQAMRGIVVDLRTMTVAQEFELPPGIVVHFANSFEADSELVTDFFHATSTEGFAWLGDVFDVQTVAGARLQRLRINLKTGHTSLEAFDHAPAGEFPAWNTNRTGLRSEHCFYVGHAPGREHGFFNSFVTLNTRTGAFTQTDVGENRYTSEALFTAKACPKTQDDGYLLAVVYDARSHRSEIQIRDAQNPEEEIAAVLLDHHIPFGFHGHFTANTFLK